MRRVSLEKFLRALTKYYRDESIVYYYHSIGDGLRNG